MNKVQNEIFEAAKDINASQELKDAAAAMQPFGTDGVVGEKTAQGIKALAKAKGDITSFDTNNDGLLTLEEFQANGLFNNAAPLLRNTYTVVDEDNAYKMADKIIKDLQVNDLQGKVRHDLVNHIVNNHYKNGYLYSGEIITIPQDLIDKALLSPILTSNLSPDNSNQIYSIHLDEGGGKEGTHSHLVEQSLRDSSELEVVGSYHLETGELSKTIEHIKKVQNGEIEGIPQNAIIAVTMSYGLLFGTKGVFAEEFYNQLNTNGQLTNKLKEDIKEFRRTGFISPDLEPLIWSTLKEGHPHIYKELQELKKLTEMENVFVTTGAGNGQYSFSIKSLIDRVITVTDPDTTRYAYFEGVDAEFPAKVYDKSGLREGTSFGSPAYLGEYLNTHFRPNHEKLEYEQNSSILANEMNISEKEFKEKYPITEYKIADVESQTGKIITILNRDTQDVVFTYGVNNDGLKFTESPMDWSSNWFVDFESSVKDNKGTPKNLFQFLQESAQANPAAVMLFADKWIPASGLSEEEYQEIIIDAIAQAPDDALAYANHWISSSQLPKAKIQEIIIDASQKFPEDTVIYANNWIPASGMPKETYQEIMLNAIDKGAGYTTVAASNTWLPVCNFSQETVYDIFLTVAKGDECYYLLPFAERWILSSGLSEADVRMIVSYTKDEEPEGYKNNIAKVEDEIKKIKE